MERSLREELMAEVDDVFSENIRLLPLASGHADPDRNVVEIAAVLRTGERVGEKTRFGRSNSARADVMASGGQLRIDRSAYPDLVLRQHDKVVALDRDSQPVFEIMAVDDRSHLRLICELGDAN